MKFNFRRTSKNSEREAFLEEWEKITQMLDKNEIIFNMITDNDLTEALIYEKLALELRFTYLLKQARKKGIRLDYTDRLNAFKQVNRKE